MKNTEVGKIDDKMVIRTTLKDHSSEDAGTLDVIITINNDGIEIRPANEEDLYDGDGAFFREVWVEFYCSQFRAFIWDGTQEDPVVQHVLLERG